MRKIIVPALAALSLGTVATQGAAETVSVDISYADLDLTTPEGLSVLHGRIKAAINRVCPEADQRSTQRQAARERCLAEAATVVDAQLARITDKSPALAMLRSSKGRN